MASMIEHPVDNAVKADVITGGAGTMRAVRYYGKKDVRLDHVPIPICGKGQVKVVKRTTWRASCGFAMHVL